MLITKTTHRRLTDTSVKNFHVKDKAEIVWDGQLAAFGLRVSPTGRKSYFLMYRSAPCGRVRKKVIGHYGIINTAQARDIAREWLLMAQSGRDPNAASAPTRNNPTVSELCDRYVAQHSKPNKKPRSVQMDKDIIRRIVKPEIGNLRIQEVTRYAVSELHSKLSSTPAKANNVRSFLHHLFVKAEEWQLRATGTNPVSHVKRFKVKPRRRFLRTDELRRLGQALRSIEETEPEAATILQLFCLSGCRRQELLELKWVDVNLDGRCLHLSDSKTGPKDIAIGDAAVALLRSWPKTPGNDYVFPGKKAGSHLTSIKRPWRRVRELAELEDVRLHDLRRTFATYAAQSDVSLHSIQGLLGHSTVAMTERYTQHVPSQLADAATSASGYIRQIMAEGVSTDS